MNKLNKIGLSALCGSLASMTAYAGTLDVTGSAEATYTSRGGEVTGNPIGMKSNLSFVGNGELDGGQTFSVTIAHTDKATWSSSNITLNTNSLGTFVLSSAEGGQGIGGYDDNMPRAWEEVWDTGVGGINANFQKGVGSSTNISWTSPKFAGTTLQVAYAPDNDGAQNADKATSGSTSDDFGAGYDIVLDVNPNWDAGGFNWFIGASETTKAKERGAAAENISGDHQEAVTGLTLNIGPVEIGGQISAERLRAVTYGAVDYYANTSWGVAFNVNDDLSFSYGEARSLQAKTKHESGKRTVEGAGALSALAHGVQSDYIPKSRMVGESWQIAYTIGGVALKYADTKWDNSGYSYDAKIEKNARTLAVSMAF